MWMVLPALYLAMIRIAGHNIGVVPDAAPIVGEGIFATTVIAYIVFGSLLSALLAWIGVCSGQELIVFVKKILGDKCKKAIGFTILAVCIPASALTGAYFSGWVVHNITGYSQSVCAVFCMIAYAIMATGFAKELLKLSNYISLFLLPLILLIWFNQETSIGYLEFNMIDWPFVFALVGYNAGGMHSVLVVETAAHFNKKGYKMVLLAVFSKLVETAITLIMVQLVFTFETTGPLALVEVINQVLGPSAYKLFCIIVFCSLVNVMVPAMFVNAKQITSITGLAFYPALFLATLIVYFVSLLDYNYILNILSVAGFCMLLSIVYISYYLHANYIKRE